MATAVTPETETTAITLARPRTELRCRACGYGIVVSGEPPACPMCRAELWETLGWRPFSAREAASI